MKAVFINHSDSLGGASTVTARLVDALRVHCDVDARMLVASASNPGPYVVQAASRLRAKVPFAAEHLRIFAGNGFSRDTLFKISLATDGLPLSRHPLVEEADVVVLNWVNQGMLSLNEIARIARRKPLVWTMHDMWNATGVCHHAGTCLRFTEGCGHCPLLHGRASATDLSAATFERKRRLYAEVPIHFVAVSRWLAERAAASPLMDGQKITVIPNTYSPTPPITATPAELGLPDTEAPLVTICAARLDDPVKGLPLAVEALNSVADLGVTAVLVGEIRHPQALANLRVPCVKTGVVADRNRLSAIFAHSAAVLSSSLYETFGATLLEAQAAGTTPVAFTHDGRADIITHGKNGYAAAQTTGAALGAALRQAITAPLAPETLRQAAERFSPAAVAGRYNELLAVFLQK